MDRKAYNRWYYQNYRKKGRLKGRNTARDIREAARNVDINLFERGAKIVPVDKLPKEQKSLRVNYESPYGGGKIRYETDWDTNIVLKEIDRKKINK